jgi:predicted metal-binding protein
MKEIKNSFQPIYQRERAFEDQLQQDLKTLVGKIEKIPGVNRAAVIPAKNVIVDDKVRWKCKYPVCFGYNSSILCPPHTPPAEECKRIIHSFRYAIIFQHEVPIEDFTDRSKGNVGMHFAFINETAQQAEEWANSMGYRQAVAFQAGMCTQYGSCMQVAGGTTTTEITKSGAGIVACAVLQGKTCRHPCHVRPSMEAMAIDVIGTVMPLGWDLVYIGGKTNDPSDIPCASSMGLCLVA